MGSPFDDEYHIEFTENGILYSSIIQYVWSKASNDYKYLAAIFSTDDCEEIVSMGSSYFDRRIQVTQNDHDKQIVIAVKNRFESCKNYFAQWARYLKVRQNLSRYVRLRADAPPLFDEIFAQIDIELQNPKNVS